jgi:hypothetical protein
MNQREYWEGRISAAFSERRKKLEAADADNRAKRIKALEAKVGITDDLTLLDRADKVREQVIATLQEECKRQGVTGSIYWKSNPMELLIELDEATKPADAAMQALAAERERLLARLHAACGTNELRAAIAEIETALAD